MSSFTIAVGGNATANLPIAEQLPLAHAFLLYEYPSYFEIGGGFEFDPPLLKITGAMDGFLDGVARTFDLQGQVDACLRGAITISIGPINEKIEPCFSTGAVVSSKGAAFCGTIPIPTPFGAPVPVTITVGYRWGDSGPGFKLFSCDFGDYQVASAHAAAAGSSSFELAPGAEPVTIRLQGAAGAPDATLSGPGGAQISTTSPPSAADVVVLHVPEENETLVGLRHPAAGSWSVATAPDSTAITSVALARALPAPHLVAHVMGKGTRRLLVYRFAAAPGRLVTFTERGTGAYQVLGRVSGPSGRMAFTSATGGAGRRQIVASISENGAPVRDLTVTTYTASRPARLPAPGGVKLIRRGTHLNARWHRVRGAASYAVTLVQRGGHVSLLITHGTSVSFTPSDPRARARVTIVAVGGDGRRGRPGSAAVGGR